MISNGLSAAYQADMMAVPRISIDDLEKGKVRKYLSMLDMASDYSDYVPDLKRMQDIGAISGDSLTLAGLMFFGSDPQRFRSQFCVKAVSFVGNERSGDKYRDSEDITGTIPDMFIRTMSFLKRNLRWEEISEVALSEIVQNALLHRDFSVNSPVLVFIFDERVEVISPGQSSWKSYCRENP